MAGFAAQIVMNGSPTGSEKIRDQHKNLCDQAKARYSFTGSSEMIGVRRDSVMKGCETARAWRISIQLTNSE